MHMHNSLSMSRLTLSARRSSGFLVAVGVFSVIFVVVNIIIPRSISYLDVSFLASSVGPLALTAMGETIIILCGEFDLSAGPTISLINVLVAYHIKDGTGSIVLWVVIAILLGALVGAFNGFFVAVLRIQSAVVTLASMFIIEGITLLISPNPGGKIPASFMQMFNGDAIPGILPAPVLVLIIAAVIWTAIRKTRFGTGLYATGSDAAAAQANGIPVRRTRFLAFVLGGCFYGAGALFLSAQVGNGQPLVGSGMLLQVFAAVILGGTVLSGGRGGCVGTILGACTILMIVNLLLIMDVSLYYITIAESLVLIMAILGSSFTRGSSFSNYVKFASAKLKSLLAGPEQHGLPLVGIPHFTTAPIANMRVDNELRGSLWRTWRIRNWDTLRLILPAYAFLILILIATYFVFGKRVLNQNYLNSILTLSVFLSVLGLGQSLVIMTGGFDLSIAQIISFSGVLLSGITLGSNLSSLWVIPMVLVLGAAVGALNGFGIVLFGIPPIIMTMAMDGVIHGALLIYTGGKIVGAVPPALIWFVKGNILGFSPMVIFLILWVIAGTLLLTRTRLGRWILAIGNSKRVARLSGVRVGTTLVIVYSLSGLCSALAGVLLAGFTNIANLSMGKSYLLPTIAVVFVGGTLGTGGRGHYLGVFGGAVLLTVMSTLISGTMIPIAARDVIVGLLVLAAVLTIREKAV
jgi:ribose transport system permease protein